MDQFLQWINMGGYSGYVWSAYGLVFLVLIMELVMIRFQKKRTRSQLDQWFKKKQHDYDPHS